MPPLPSSAPSKNPGAGPVDRYGVPPCTFHRCRCRHYPDGNETAGYNSRKSFHNVMIGFESRKVKEMQLSEMLQMRQNVENLFTFSDKFNRFFSCHAVNVKAKHSYMADTF